MMTSLKTVAEAVTSLLTMLLQFLINQSDTVPGFREFPGSDASDGRMGFPAAESTDDVAKSHDFRPELPFTKGPRFN